MRRTRVPFCLLALGLVAAGAAQARNPIRTAFFNRYPAAVNSALDELPSHANHCGVCHFDFSGGGPRNPYGLSVEIGVNNGLSNAAAVAAAEPQDADNDGFSALIEVTDTVNFANTPTFPMLSGTRAAIAVKLYGPDLHELRSLAEGIKGEMAEVEGLVDLFVDQQTEVPQIRIEANRERMAMYGLRPADIDELIDVAFLGAKTSQIYEGEYRHDLIVRYAPEYRDDLEAVGKTLIDTPHGGAIPLELVADIRIDRGPNYISRENVQRKIVIQANVAGRDLRGAVEEIRGRLSANVDLPAGYFVEYGGQFESEERATRTVSLLSLVSIIAIMIALYMEFRSFRQASLIMVNLPLALIGGIVGVWMTGGVISIASLVGFITLFGIAVRNGILMVSHYNHLMDEEGKPLLEAVIQGSLERLSPILMTALTTGLALVPLALAGDKPGSELEYPMAIVILGGLVSATFLNLVVVPALYLKWGRRA
jgi:Cu/Ag efflux pump CusA